MNFNPLSFDGEGTEPGSRGQVEGHFSEDQIDDYLIGDLGAAAAAHLAACQRCESRVAEAAAPIEAFMAITAAWGERRSATLPLHQTMARSAKFHPRAAWAAAVALVLALGFALPLAMHQQRQETAQTRTDIQPVVAEANTGTGSGSDQIVRDNQMLKAIDRELDASAESPEALGLQPVDTGAKRKAEAPRSVQD